MIIARPIVKVRAIVTGGLGFIGHNIVRYLLSRGAQVLVIDNMTDGRIRMPLSLSGAGTYAVEYMDVCVMHTDLRDGKVESMLGGPANVIFHFAAHYANLRSIEEPIEDVLTNCLGTMSVLEYAVKKKIKNVVYASSSIAATETGKPEIMTPYGITKYTGELLAQSYSMLHGLNVVSPRFFNVYGYGDVPGKYRAVIPNFFQSALRGTEICITGKNQARDFTYVNDVVKAVFAGLEMVVKRHPGGGKFLCYNIAKGSSESIVELVQEIVDLTGSTSQIKILDDRDWEGIQERVGDNKSFKELFPDLAGNMTSLRKGLRESYREWYKHECK